MTNAHNMSGTHHTQAASDIGLGLKTPRVYLGGIVACLLLTLMPFYVVMHQLTGGGIAMIVIWGCALVQFVVQVVCFLRLTWTTPQGQVTVVSFVATIITALIILIGSLWIMHNLNYYMMH